MIEVFALGYNMSDDDEEVQPNQSTSSNMTSLGANGPRPNQSRTNSASNIPRAVENTSAFVEPEEKLTTYVSKNVEAHKLVLPKYVEQGRVIMSLVGNFDLQFHQINLCKLNGESICRIFIRPYFDFSVLQDICAAFDDNFHTNWVVLFSAPSDLCDFAKQVAIAKYNVQKNKEKVFVQDMSTTDGAKAKHGDFITITYVCYVFLKDKIYPFKDKNTETIEISCVLLYPWHEGLRGCTEHGKRLILLTHKLTAPWTDDINPNTSILIEVEVISIKSSNAAPATTQEQREKSKSDIGEEGRNFREESAASSRGNEDNYKAKASLKDSIFFSRSHKTNLMTKIGKMEQSLPIKGTFLPTSRDSGEECSSLTRRENNLRGLNKTGQQFNQSAPMQFGPCCSDAFDPHYDSSCNQICKCNNDDTWQQQKMKTDFNVACQDFQPCRTAPPTLKEKDSEKIHCSDGKGIEPEFRLAIDKVSEKVDYVLDRLQKIDARNCEKLKEKEAAEASDTVGIVCSIQGVIVDNENLKSEIQMQNHKIDEQNRKFKILMNLIHRYVEDYAVPERQSVSTDKVISLEEQLRSTNQFLNEANLRINQLASDVEKYKRQVCENQRHIKERNVQMHEIAEKLKEKERMVLKLESELVLVVAENLALATLKAAQKKETLDNKREDTGEACTSSKIPSYAPSDDSSEEIKKVMNAVNKKLQSHFELDRNYSGSHIKEIIATTIKDVTMEYLRYKSKMRSFSNIDFKQRDDSRAAFDSNRMERASREPGSPSHTQNIDSDRYTGQRKSSDNKASSQKLTFLEDHDSEIPNGREKFEEVRAPGELTKSALDEKKSQLHACEIAHTTPEGSRPSPELSGPSQVPERTDATGDDFENTATNGKKSPSQETEESSTSQTHTITFTDEGEGAELDHGFSEAISSVDERSAILSRMLTNATKGKVVASSRRTGNSLVDFTISTVILNKNVPVLTKVSALAPSWKSPPTTENEESGIDAENEENTWSTGSRVRATGKVQRINMKAEQAAANLKHGISRRSTTMVKDQNSGINKILRDLPLANGIGSEIDSETVERVEFQKSTLTLNKAASDLSKTTAKSTSSRRSVLKNQNLEINRDMNEDDSNAKSKTGIIDEKEQVETFKIGKAAVTLREAFDIADKGGLSASIVAVKTQASRKNKSVKEENFGNINAVTQTVEGEHDGLVLKKFDTLTRDTTAACESTSDIPTVLGTDRSVKTKKAQSSVTQDEASQPFSAQPVATSKQRVFEVESLGRKDGTVVARYFNEDVRYEESDVDHLGEWKSSEEIRIVDDETQDEENENYETQKNSSDDKESSTSEVIVKSSGSNTVYGSCLFTDNYGNWGLSEIPPLAPNDGQGDDDEPNDNNEEWF